MRFFLTFGLTALFLGSGLRATEPLLIETGKIRGVIFTPSQVTTACSPWKDLLPDDRKRILFWTPSRTLIDKAERALFARVAETRMITPPRGFHFQEYYTPKYYSRDRVAHMPDVAYRKDYEFLSDQMDRLAASHPRQYIGITIDEKKALVLNFLGNPPDRDWKRKWKDDRHLYYLIESGEFTPIQFGIEVEDR